MTEWRAPVHWYEGPIEQWRIEALLATRRIAPSNRAWQERLHAMQRARIHAMPDLRLRLDEECAAMLAAEDAARDARWAREARFVDEDAATMLLCEMRDPSVRGLTRAEVVARRVCFVCGRPLPLRRIAWCSDECPREWNAQHEWSAASFAALKRDDHACVRCGSKRSPEVNHRIPLVGRGYHQGCHHHRDGLETLCHDCHTTETTRQRRERAAFA